MKAIFVGGPLDGQQRELAPSVMRFQAQSAPPLSAADHAIQAEQVIDVTNYVPRVFLGVTAAVWAPEGTNEAEAVRRLMDGYTRGGRS